jgi:ribulose-5-phosphate 4-epimerase/fuculose-1-phosphate aldolase
MTTVDTDTTTTGTTTGTTGNPNDQARYNPIPELPERSFAEERVDRKVRLTAAIRIFGRHGFDHGQAGHVTVRDPEHTDCFWVNPINKPFRLVRVSDLLLVNGKGEVLEGNGRPSTGAIALHAKVHAARPDVNAVAHAHGVYSTAFSTLGRLLVPITQDDSPFYEDHALLDEFTGRFGDPEEGDRVAAALGSTKAVIMRNHGLLTVGRTIDEAAWHYLNFERAAQVQLLAMAAGRPKPLSHEAAIAAGGGPGSLQAADWARYSFQPMYQLILAEEPDLLT